MNQAHHPADPGDKGCGERPKRHPKQNDNLIPFAQFHMNGNEPGQRSARMELKVFFTDPSSHDGDVPRMRTPLVTKLQLG